MRIISKFKDYYDSMAGPQTPDELPIFLREEQELAFEVYLPGGAGLTDTAKHLLPVFQLIDTAPRLSELSTTYNYVSMEVTIIAGRMYPSYFDRPNAHMERPIRWNDVPEVLEAIEQGTIGFDTEGYNHTLKALRKAVEHSKKSKCDKTWNNYSGSKTIPSTRLGLYPFSLYGWEEFKRDFSYGFSGEEVIRPEVHRFFRSPILHVYKPARGRSYTCVISPRLKDLSFSSIRLPHLVAQDIDQYLGNQMARQLDPVPVRTQELIRDAHGFDDTSFKHGTPDRRARKQHKPHNAQNTRNTR